ncbi:hypothetical protein [Natranaeroarchaeum aerophilus]|uniref:Uncharacterized protein n=1 Tax=Natranaeroarchaeum aerophilus TaxID=2917711 RepID=A0AAE3FSK5_9EURY|nr:hypothetical protein [Natranaeroarchaeum aerophilus]MCL9814401.1 hypothetical protein [Natranaeroarchaeum aerophilus]
MFKHDYHRQLTPGERMAVALFHFGEKFTAKTLADFVGISNKEARERLHALEHLGVVTIVDDAGPYYKYADLDFDLLGEDRCNWCSSNRETNSTIQTGTPVGNYVGLSGNETVDLCDKCLERVSNTVNGVTDQTNSGQDILPIYPICQAESCNQLAARTIASQRGHPHQEWKLCANHYNEVDGSDPHGQLGHGWILKKLYYRCPNGGEISHNLILLEQDDDGYACSCGSRHTAISVDSE